MDRRDSLLDESDAPLLGGLVEIRYDSQADVMIFILREKPPVDSLEEPGGVIISYGEDHEPVSVEFLQASKRELLNLKQTSIPLSVV